MEIIIYHSVEMDEKKHPTAKKVVDKDKKKNKPGRPRKTPARIPVPRNGIADKPNRDTNVMELIYDNPDAFKRIFGMYKSMAVASIRITFEERRIVFRCVDHYGKSNIQVVIDASKINHYYCEDVFTITLAQKNMERLVRILDKSYITISFVSTIADQHTILNMVYKNDLKIDETYEIDLVDGNGVDEEPDINDTGYQVKFTFPGKFFKKMVNDIGAFTDVLTFDKTCTGPLTYSWLNRDKTLKATHVAKDPTTIKLESNMNTGDIFGTTIVIDYIEKFAGSSLSDFITISADTDKDIIFQSVMDKGVVHVKVKTSTVNRK